MKKSISIWTAVLAFAAVTAVVGGCMRDLGDETAAGDKSGYHKVGGEGGGYHPCTADECDVGGAGGGSDTTTTHSTTSTTHTTTSTTTVVEDECVEHGSCENMDVNDVCATDPGDCTDILICGSNHVWKLLQADVDCGAGGAGGGSTGSTSSSTTSSSSSTSSGTVANMVIDIIPRDQSKAHTFDNVSGLPPTAQTTTLNAGKVFSISVPMLEGQALDAVSVRIDSAYYTCGPDASNPANHFTVVVRAKWGSDWVEPVVVSNGGTGCNIKVVASHVGYAPVGMCDQNDRSKHPGQLETWGDAVDFDCDGHNDPSNWNFTVSGLGAGWEMELVDWSKPSPVSYTMTLDIPSGKYKVSVPSWHMVTDYNVRYRVPGGAWNWSPYNWNGCHIEPGIVHDVRDSIAVVNGQPTPVPFTAPANLSPAQNCHFVKQ